MTASQPPEERGEVLPDRAPGSAQPAAPQPPPGGPGWGQQPPPGYGQQPGYGQPSPPPGYGPVPGAPGYGQGHGQAPSWSAPPHGYGPPPQPAAGPPGPGRPGAPSGISLDVARLRVADYVVAVGTVLYLVLALFPWWDYGGAFFLPTLSGFEGSGAVSSAFVFFLLATAWALLPALYDVELGFPRAWVTVGLAAVGFLLTLLVWLQTFDAGFSIWALLGLLTAAAILVFALLALLPQLRDRPAGWPVGAQPPGEPRPYGQTRPPPPPPAAPGRDASPERPPVP